MDKQLREDISQYYAECQELCSNIIASIESFETKINMKALRRLQLSDVGISATLAYPQNTNGPQPEPLLYNIKKLRDLCEKSFWDANLYLEAKQTAESISRQATRIHAAIRTAYEHNQHTYLAQFVTPEGGNQEMAWTALAFLLESAISLSDAFSEDYLQTLMQIGHFQAVSSMKKIASAALTFAIIAMLIALLGCTIAWYGTLGPGSSTDQIVNQISETGMDVIDHIDNAK